MRRRQAPGSVACKRRCYTTASPEAGKADALGRTACHAMNNGRESGRCRVHAGQPPARTDGYFWSAVSVLPLLTQKACAPLCTGVTTPSNALSTVIAVAALATECMNFRPSSE